MPSQKVLSEKQQIVETLKEKISKAKSIILVDYRGLTVEQDTELRNRLRNANIEYKVLKNTLVLFAAKENNLEGLAPFLNGPTAVAFSYDDEVSTSKVLADYAKENEKLEIKAGVVDGKIVSVNEIKALASLPPKEVLVAQVLGGLNAPITGFVNVLQGNIRNLVYALNAIAQKQA